MTSVTLTLQVVYCAVRKTFRRTIGKILRCKTARTTVV